MESTNNNGIEIPETNVIGENSLVKKIVLSSEEAVQLTARIKADKLLLNDTIQGIFNDLEKLFNDKTLFENLRDKLTGKQIKTLIISELEFRTDDKNTLNRYAVAKWYYVHSGLTLHKESVNVSNLKLLKKYAKYYTKASVKACKGTSAEYNKALNDIITNAVIISDVHSLIKEDKSLVGDFNGFSLSASDKVEFELNNIDHLQLMKGLSKARFEAYTKKYNESQA